MRLRLSELRQLLRMEDLLFTEGFDIATMANRGIASRGIVIYDASLIAVSMNELVKISELNLDINDNESDSDDLYLPKVVGVASIKVSSENFSVLDTLYADDPVTAVMLLGAALEYFKRVIPDTMISPAAQAVVKRYFEEFKDDPKRIEQDFILNRSNVDFVRALYKGPIGFDLDSAISNGEVVVNEVLKKSNDDFHTSYTPDDLIMYLFRSAKMGFHDAYRNVKRTKK